MAKHRDYNFFDQFIELIKYSCESLVLLHSSLENFNIRTRKQKLEELCKITDSSKTLQDQIKEQLAATFLPPLEREDILNLSQKINNITKGIKEVLLILHIYQVESLKSDVFGFAKLITLYCNTLKSVLEEFPGYQKSKSLKSKLAQVYKLEEKGEELYETAVTSLSRSLKTGSDLFIWSKIYDELRSICTICIETAWLLEVIIIKNS